MTSYDAEFLRYPYERSSESCGPKRNLLGRGISVGAEGVRNFRTFFLDGQISTCLGSRTKSLTLFTPLGFKIRAKWPLVKALGE